MGEWIAQRQCRRTKERVKRCVSGRMDELVGGRHFSDRMKGWASDSVIKYASD